ncbi:MAG: ATP-binding protein [Methanocorpusculum sp.]|nr:ATP-binding protein [Methanocorpusculum sp.]
MTNLLGLLIEQNPHWEGKMPDTGVRRSAYLKKIQTYYDTGEIVVLNGVRRAGKTTLLLQTIQELIQKGANPKSILFVNCDEPQVHNLNDPMEEILQVYRSDVYGQDNVTLIFDEIQTIPEWQRWIKAWYDRKKYRIIISGSSSYLLDAGLSTKISGRYLKVPVYPLDFAEYLAFHHQRIPADRLEETADKFTLLTYMRQYLQYGGFPASARIADESVRSDHLAAYFDSILFRDIEGLHDIRSPGGLRKLLIYLITNIASPFSYRNLAKLFGLDPRIAADYISFAEEANLLFEIQNFSYSLKAQNTGSKKIYTIDGGLRNAVAFSFSADEGRLVENAVFIQLKRMGFLPYFWRGTNEVDFVVQKKDRSLISINVCYTDAIPEREAAGLHEFAEAFAGQTVSLMMITKDTEKEEGGIVYVPLWKWMLAGGNPGSLLPLPV